MPTATLSTSTIDPPKAAESSGGHATWGGRENFNSWDEGRSALIQFLQDVKKLLEYLVKNRIPADDRQLYEECLLDASRTIDDVIAELREIKTEGHPTYTVLQRVGMVGRHLRLKLRDFYRLVKSGPVDAVLEMADNILESAAEAFPPLELVSEFKHAVEIKLKHGGDAGIISLNLGGNEQWWQSKPAGSGHGK